MYRFVKIIWIWCMGFYEVCLLVSLPVCVWVCVCESGCVGISIVCASWLVPMARLCRLWIWTAEFRSNQDSINPRRHTCRRRKRSEPCECMCVCVSESQSLQDFAGFFWDCCGLKCLISPLLFYKMVMHITMFLGLFCIQSAGSENCDNCIIPGRIKSYCSE